MMYIILLRNANISSIPVIFRDGFSFFNSCFSNTEDAFFFYFCLYYFFPVIKKDDTLQNVMVLFRYCENNHDSIFKLSVVHVAGTKVSLYHVLTTMVFKLKLLNQKSTSLRSIVCYELCGLCITFDNIKNLNSVR